MWVKISKPEDTKKLKVGDKVRVDGTEYKCTHTYYSPTDYGFDIYGKLPHGGRVLSHGCVRRFEYTIELWEGEETTMNKQYKIKLRKGDACKIEGLTEEQYHQVCKRFINSGASSDYYREKTFQEYLKDYDYVMWYCLSLCPCYRKELEPNATIYTYEQIMEEENQMLERDKEYDIKLTGEELFLFTFMLGQSNSSLSGATYEKLKKMFIPEFESLLNSISTLKTIDLYSHKSEIIGIMDKVFPKPETEQEKKIREMEEQYAALGKAIEEVKKGSK